MSAASFLGIAGLIALFGYDGFLYSIGFLVAWLVALLLVAELMRNSGRYTMGDVLAFRMRQRPVRMAAGISTITVSIFYLIAQMVGAGALVALLLGIARPGTLPRHVPEHREERHDRPRRRADDPLRHRRRHARHHLGADGQGRPADDRRDPDVGLRAGQVQLQPVHPARRRRPTRAARATRSSTPGLRYGAGDWKTKVDLISLGLALVLGTAGLPHILMRFYTVPTARDARRSVNWAIGLIGAFYLLTLALGFGAAALVGTQAIRAANPGGNTAAPQLAEELGGGTSGPPAGRIFLAFIAAVAFATILAVVAGLTLASSSSVAHDIYANVIRKGDVDERSGGRVARIAAVVIGAIAIVLSIFAQNLNVAFLVALAFAVAASGNLPAILYSLFWRRFNTAGRDRGPSTAGSAWPCSWSSSRRWCPAGHRDDQRQGLRLVPAGEPGHHLDPGRLLLRLARHGPVPRARRRQVRRARGPVADRGRGALRTEQAPRCDRPARRAPERRRRWAVGSPTGAVRVLHPRCRSSSMPCPGRVARPPGLRSPSVARRLRMRVRTGFAGGDGGGG